MKTIEIPDADLSSKDPNAIDGCGPIASARDQFDNRPPHPNGFFQARTMRHKPWGLGFCCHKCKFCVDGGLVAGQIIRHCGKTEVTPELSGWNKLMLPKSTRPMVRYKVESI